MNKHIVFLLAAIMVLAVAIPALAEDAAGDWYTDADGLPVHLVLGADGTFILSAPGQEDISGTWELDEGFVQLALAGQEIETLALNGAALVHDQGGLIFTREQSEAYTPAGPLAGVTAELYAGYWKAAYVDMMGTPVLASAFEDETDLYVEGTHAILGGPVLGDVIVALTFADGAFTGDNEGAAVQLQLQQDGFLRMTVTGTDTAPQTWYLLRAYSPILDGENPAEAAAEP